MHHHHLHALDSLNTANANGAAGETTTTTLIGLRQPNRLFGVDNIGASAIVMANQVIMSITRSFQCRKALLPCPFIQN